MLESGSNISTSDPISAGVITEPGYLITAEAGIVRREPEIRMAEARIISAPPPPFNTQNKGTLARQNQPNRNDEESALPKWYTDMQRSPYSFKM
jgi:hypothetical protein